MSLSTSAEPLEEAVEATETLGACGMRPAYRDEKAVNNELTVFWREARSVGDWSGCEDRGMVGGVRMPFDVAVVDSTLRGCAVDCDDSDGDSDGKGDDDGRPVAVEEGRELAVCAAGWRLRSAAILAAYAFRG